MSSYSREYYLKNQEKLQKQRLAYYYRNRDEILDKIKEKNKRPKAKRYYTISNWKRVGILSEDYDDLYDRYVSCDTCENCRCEFSIKGDGVGNFRTLHHDHNSGEPLMFVCQPCNVRFK